MPTRSAGLHAFGAGARPELNRLLRQRIPVQVGPRRCSFPPLSASSASSGPWRMRRLLRLHGGRPQEGKAILLYTESNYGSSANIFAAYTAPCEAAVRHRGLL